MREIKFRAWYRQSGMMGTYDLMSIDRGLSDWEWSQDQDVYFMQYTGLKDKNGKEIYFDDYVKTLIHIYIVKQTKFKISLVNISDGSITELSNLILGNLSVLGNKYENSEGQIREHAKLPKK